MGIHGFYRWVTEQYEKGGQEGFKITQRVKPNNIACVFFDLNGIFHDAAGEVYGYKKSRIPQEAQRLMARKNAIAAGKFSAKELKAEHLKTIVIKIFEVIDLMKPTHYAVLAVDGVAPSAKITQQRSRRYKAAFRDEEFTPEGTEEIEEKVKTVSPFDSNCITPGTEFMFELDEYIKRFLVDNIRANNFTVDQLVYSSHLVPGEGEHKIFNLIRKENVNLPKNAVSVIYGSDADLFMLSSLSPQPFLYLYRAEDKTYVNIDEFKRRVIQDMTESDKEFPVPQKIIIQDFVLILYTIGNDFLPHLIAFDDLKKSINQMFLGYGNLGKPLTTEDGQIIWENFSEFLNFIAKKEPVLISSIENSKFTTPISALSKAESETDDGGRFFDMNIFRKNWYDNALNPRHPEANEMLSKFEIPKFSHTEADIKEMCMEYFKGMQWILRYYMFGPTAITSRYVYVYLYAPLLYDLASVLSKAVKSKEKLPNISDVKENVGDVVIKPVHQLMAVMPPSSWELIPTPWRQLMYLRFRDIAPSKFYVDMQGTKKGTEYKGIPCISIVDLTRLERDIQDYPVTKKFNYEIDKFIKNFRSPPPPPRYNKGLIAELRNAEKYELAASEDLTAGVVLTGKIEEALEDVEEEMILEASGVVASIGPVEDEEEIQGERIRRKRRPKPADFPWQNAYLI